MTWLSWLAGTAYAQDVELVTATAVEGMTLETLTTSTSGALRIEVARFDADGQHLSVHCESFLGKQFSCEIWTVEGVLLFGNAEAKPCRRNEAPALLADKPGIGRWLVAYPVALYPVDLAATPTCDSLQAPPETRKGKREKP